MEKKQDIAGAGSIQAEKIKDDLEEEELLPPPSILGNIEGTPRTKEGTREKEDFPHQPPPSGGGFSPPTMPPSAMGGVFCQHYTYHSPVFEGKGRAQVFRGS